MAGKLSIWRFDHEQFTIHPIVIIVGGAFQNFNSYKYCVEQFFESGPVILIDLPSMGANQQITNIDSGLSAGTLELPDLSRMLGQWLDIVAIEKLLWWEFL
jgi:pimeloyl-ACP methyl ester carboxylesterase